MCADEHHIEACFYAQKLKLYFTRFVSHGHIIINANYTIPTSSQKVTLANCRAASVLPPIPATVCSMLLWCCNQYMVNSTMCKQLTNIDCWYTHISRSVLFHTLCAQHRCHIINNLSSQRSYVHTLYHMKHDSVINKRLIVDWNDKDITEV